MAASAQDAHPYPIYNARFRLTVPLLDADGDPVSPSSPDTELSQDSGTFADATNEATELATSSGIVYVDLIATELDTTVTAVKVASTGAKTTIAVLNPRRLPIIRTGTAQAGAATTITLDSNASAIDDYYVGCYVNCTNDTPANVRGQARVITDYVGSTKVATVATWGTNPSSSTTFEILATPDWIYRLGDVLAWNGTAIATPDTAGYPKVTIKDGTGQGEIALTSGAVDAVTTVTTTTTATNLTNLPAITSNWLTAAGIAAGALNGKGDWNIGKTGYALSSAGVQAIWDTLTSALTAVGSVGKLIVDYLDAAISSRASQTSVDTVDGIVDAILVDTGTDIPARFTGVEGATFDTATDSLEAIRNRGDAAWTTGAGGANPAVLQNTTIATLASQTSFTLTAGSADNDAYNGHLIVVTDQTTAEQKAVGVVLDYVGSTKTITLAADPAIFTMAVGDEVDILVGKANMVAINGGLTNGNNATLSLAQLNIVNSGGSAIVASSTGGNGHGVVASGNGTGEGVSATGGDSGHGIEAIGGSGTGIGFYARGQASPGGEGMRVSGAGSSAGLRLDGGSSGSAGLSISSSSNGNGVSISGSGSGHGLSVTGGATGNGIHVRGGATSGDGINAAAQTSGDGMELAGAGGGYDLNADIQGVVSGTIDANVIQISGDATAADNAEAFFDGTGYAGTNNVIPTVTTVTNQVTANVTAVSGDSGAADNLEADYDGTGYNKSASTIGTATALSSTERNNIADALLKRDWTAVTGEAARSVLNALRFLRNKWSVSGTTLTVTKEDDATSAWTAVVTTDAAADPVTGSDPT